MEIPKTATLAKSNTIFFMYGGISANTKKSTLIFAKRLVNTAGPNPKAKIAVINTNFAFTSPYLNSIGIYIPYIIALNNSTVNIAVRSRVLS